MTEKKEADQERSRLRKIAKELAEDEKRKLLEIDRKFIADHGLDLKPGHLDKMELLAKDRKIPIYMAARELRKQIMHDDLDFTLPFTPVPRLRRIIYMVTEVSLSKSWAETFRLYLENEDPEPLLNVMEYISWKAFDARQSLFFFCQNLNEFPKMENFQNESR